jgi:hypothetical protein
VPFIKVRFRGRCTICDSPIAPGENAFYADKKLICAGCSDVVEAAKTAGTDGPVASALQFRGTSPEVIRQLRSLAQRLTASLAAAAREAEALTLGLKQIEDQQKENRT